MIEEIELIFHRWVEDVWNNGNEEMIDELFDENGVASYQYLQGHDPIYGLEGYKKFFRLIRRAYSDIKVSIEQIASDGNKVVAVCTFAAKRLNRQTEDRPAREAVKVTGLCQITFRDGKIVHVWNNLTVFNGNFET